MTKRIHSRGQNRAYARKYAKLYETGLRLRTPALGYQRRVQALCAIGYTYRSLSEATGLSEVFLRHVAYGRFQSIDKLRAQSIDKAYRTLCVQPQHKSREAKIARVYAKRAGYYPPMAWDDIDDPKERPKGVRTDPCSTKGCTRFAETRGMCDTHYRNLRKRGRRGWSEEQQQEAA